MSDSMKTLAYINSDSDGSMLAIEYDPQTGVLWCDGNAISDCNPTQADAEAEIFDMYNNGWGLVWAADVDAIESNVVTVTVYDGDPCVSGPCAWDGEYADRVVADVGEAREVLEDAASVALGLDDYASGDSLWALVWQGDLLIEKLSTTIGD